MKNLTSQYHIPFSYLIIFVCTLMFSNVVSAGLGIPRAQVCHGPSAAKTVAMNRVWDTTCGTFGKITGKVCEKANPYPNFDKIWDFCVECHFDNNCEEYWGDPHIITRDGLRYNFQASGDFALIENDNLKMQVRLYGPNNSNVSYVYGVAVEAGNHKITIDYLNNLNNIPTITLNGVAITLENGDWYELESPAGFIQRLGSGYRVEINDHVSLGIRGRYLRVNLDDQFNGKINGMLSETDADPLNDLRTADGTIIDSSDSSKTGSLYTTFADDWRRDGEQSMFLVPLPEREPFDNPPLLSDLDPAVVEDARLQCIDAGIEPGRGLSECIYDLAVTGDISSIEDTQMLSPSIETSISATAFSSTDLSVFTLNDIDSVGVNVPGAGAGALSGPNNIDEYRFNIPSDQSRLLVMASPCPTISTLRAMLLKEGAPVFELPLTCETVIAVSQSLDAIRVFSDYGQLTQYAFNLVAPVTRNLGDINIGEHLSGVVTRGEVLAGNILLPPDTLIYARTLTSEPCEGKWELTDSDGISLSESVSLCEDLGLIKLSGSTPCKVKISGVADSEAYLLDILLADEAFASLDAVSVLSAGEEITVRWTGPGNDQDYISLARIEQINGSQYETYEYVTSESDHVTLTVPGVPGEYEIRYVVYEDRQIIARKSLTVEAVSASLVSPSAVDAGTEMTVQWTGPGNTRDYITLARIDQVNGNQYETYEYVTSESDQVTLTVPGVPGNYEVRYILNSDAQIIARKSLTVEAVSASLVSPSAVDAGTEMTVQWTGPGNTRDYITLARIDQVNGNQYETYEYVTSESDQVTLTVPGVPGNYEVRYILNSDAQIIARKSLTVEAVSASLVSPSAVDAGTEMTVQWTGPGNTRDYITLARIDQVNGNQYETYEYVTSESDQVTLTVPSVPGSYEVRYILNSDAQIIARQSLTVNSP